MDVRPQSLSSQSLTLVIDRENILADGLVPSLRSETVVLVAKESLLENGAVIFVPFAQHVPKIPEGLYGRVVFVWDNESKHLLEPLMKKAHEWKSRVFVVLFQEDEKMRAEMQAYNATVFVVGDMFGGIKKQPLDTLLESAKFLKKIRLSGMGLHSWRPVFFHDVIKKIAEVIEGEKNANKVLFVGPSHVMTALGIAHLLQKIDPEILIDFSGEEEVVEKEQDIVSVFDAYQASGRLRAYFTTLRVGRRSQGSRDITFSKQSHKKNNKKRKWWYVVYVFLVLLFLPCVFIAGSSGLGLFFLSNGVQDAEKGQFVGARQKVDAAVVMLSFARSSVDAVSMINNISLRNPLYEGVHRQIVAGSQLAVVASDAISVGEKLSLVFVGKSLDVRGDVEGVVGGIKHATVLLSTISKQDVPQMGWAVMDNAKALSNFLSGVVDEFPQVIAGDKKYLVLFQNNMELRPGGGFIGSYGLLQLHNGKIESFTIHDVYDADGQLKGHVEPPFAIRRHIPLVHLYLRDSNFDGDFGNDAKIAAYMLEQETGDRVDGVVGIDLNVLKGLLASVGSVYVPSFNQTVTKENFFQLLEEHSEKNFFPGSTQKKDFLNAFASALLSRLQHGMSGIALLDGMVASLQQKHIAFGFADPSVQAPFALTGLSGSLVDTRASKPATLNDFLGIIEANLGVNKVNAFVTRKVSQDVSIRENGDVDEAVSLKISNNSDGTWPGGVYKNYIRFVLPQNAKLTGVSLDSVSQNTIDAITDPSIYEAKSFVAPKGLEIAKEAESGKTLYGFLVQIPTQKTMDVRITYAIPGAYVASDLERSYNLFLWKQMGIDAYPYRLQITLPASFVSLHSSVPFAKDGQIFTYQGSVVGDRSIGFSFAQQ